MEIQFVHQRRYEEQLMATDEMEDFYIKEYILSPTGGITIAMEEVDEGLLHSLEEGSTFTKKLGMAVCSNFDRYEKKTGRDLAISRMVDTEFTVTEITVNSREILVSIEDQDGVELVLRKSNGGRRVFLIEKL